MSDWKEYTLGDISRNISRRFDFNAYPNVVFINTGDVLNNKFLHCDISNIKDLPGQAKKAIKKGDILYSEIRPGNGRYLFVDKDLDNYVVSTKFMVIEPNINVVLPEFLFLLLISNETTEYFKMIAESRSGTFPQITFDSVSSLSLNIPDKETQQKILDIITPLDDKIELNTQINQTLEQIAQALFKSWFVDFDPVRAKVQALSDGLSLEQAELAAMQAISGKTAEELTALSQTQPDRYAELVETAKAFPCEMVEVDGGEVPKGWEIKPLPEIIDFLEGPGIRNWQYTDEEDGIKFINIRCIQNGDLTLTTANKITKEEAFGKYKHFQLEEDDIVVSTSGTLGRFAFVRKEHLPLSLNTSVIRFRPIKNKSTLGFIAGFVENQLQHELEIRASGSAQRNFGPTHLKQISLLVPDFKLLELHQKYASSLFEKRKQLLSEIDVLKDTRDLLLPKLLNGEIQL
ncbi:restriction endonuclease subunit S [Haemophilus parahaemolyticus]